MKMRKKFTQEELGLLSSLVSHEIEYYESVLDSLIKPLDGEDDTLFKETDDLYKKYLAEYKLINKKIHKQLLRFDGGGDEFE